MTPNYKSLLLAICLTVSGCSPLAPRPNYTKYFILTSIVNQKEAAPATVSASSAVNSQMVIAIGPIDFPNYLRRAQVVTRTAPNQIDPSPEERWGEPLDKNFTRVLSENLAQLLDTYRIEQYPWNRENQVEYQIVINVLNFETTSQSQSQLRAQWIIKDGKTNRDLYASETEATVAVGNGDTGTSIALSSDLAILSRAIASQVTVLHERRAFS